MSLHEGVVDEAARLDVLVSRLVPELSRSRATRLVKDGAVQVDGDVEVRPARTVPAGATVRVRLPPPVPDEALPQDLPLRIVHEDDDLVVVDKAPGMVVHPSAGHDDGTLVNALLHHVGDLSGIGGVQRPGIVHRLDRGTSGLLVVAKHDAAHQALAAQFAAHTAGRTYLAICYGVPSAPSGTVTSWLARHPTDRLRFASGREDQGKRAVTHWRTVSQQGELSLIACRLETGRTHQIRVHLTESGHPLVGDTLYTRRRGKVPAWLAPWADADRPMLHAWRLHLHHPADGRPATFGAPPPADFLALASAAGLTLPEEAGSVR